MAIDVNNKNPIYNLSKVEDLDMIPDENIRECCEDMFRAHLNLVKLLAPLGIESEGFQFQPNGLGESDIQINIRQEK